MLCDLQRALRSRGLRPEFGSDAALRSHDRIVPHCAMTDNTDLSGQYDPISDFGGPRQPDLRAKQSILTDVSSMTYLYEIVYLNSTSI